MATPNWQINLGGTYFDSDKSDWVTETKIADWAKPYVTSDGGYKSYNQLKSEGLWDPTNAGLQRYFDALSNTGGTSMRKSGSAGDWRTNLGARNTMFSRLGLTTADVLRQPGLGFGDPREAFGDFFDSGSYGGVEAARAAQVKASESRGGLGGILDTGVDFAKDWGQKFVIPAAMTYLGVNALGGALGGATAATGPGAALGTAEGAAAAGGTAGAGGAAGAASLMPPAIPAADPTFGGVLTQTAPGVFTNTANAAAFGASLAPGAGTSGLSSSGNPFAPSGTGVPGGGVLSTIANALPGVLGAVASNKQAGEYKDLSRDYMAVGAPARARFEASYAPGFSMEDDPGYKEALEQAAKATLHGLSVGGNPAGSPNAWAQSLSDLYKQTTYKALQDYRNQNASAGGMGALTAAAPGAANSAIASQGNVFNSIGAAANDIFSTKSNKPSLVDLYNEFRRSVQ